MGITVKQLAAASGVSVRTLHHYDAIGLLSPRRDGRNNYRVYQDADIVTLQQILLYRGMGLPLDEIKRILLDKEFDPASALKAHKESLMCELKRIKALVKTVDKTLQSLKGERTMSVQHYFHGIDSKKLEEFKEDMIQKRGNAAQIAFEESASRTKGWKKADFDSVKADFDRLHRAFVDCIEAGDAPTDSKVQELVAVHFKTVSRFYNPTQNIYAGLGELYVENGDFRESFDAYHPDLATFLREALGAYARAHLK